MPIEHFDGETAHGPVTIYISDEGQLVFVCSQDDQTWQMAGATPVLSESKQAPAKKAPAKKAPAKKVQAKKVQARKGVSRQKVPDSNADSPSTGRTAASSDVRATNLDRAREAFRAK